jgi:hypothetical protein
MHFIGGEFVLFGCEIEIAQQLRARANPGGRAGQFEFATAMADFYLQAFFNLAQMLAKKAAEIGKATTITGFQRQ